MEPEPHPEHSAALAEGSKRRAPGLFRRNPDFTKLYAAQLVSFGGDWFASVALLSLVLSETGSATLAALVIVAQTLPFAIVSPIAGVVVDRLDRRSVMVRADIARAILALGFLAARSEETIWIAFVLLVLMSSISAFFEPASSASLPNLVAKEDLARANVYIGSAWGTMLVVGSALGGFVAGRFGNDAAFIGDALTFAISGALVLWIRGRFHETQPTGQHRIALGEDIRETVSFARREHRVLALLAIKAAFGITAGVIALIAVFAVEVFHGDAKTIGFLQAARGLGAVSGPFIFRRWARGRDERLFLGLSIAGIVFGGGYALFAVAPNQWVAGVGATVAHLGGGSIWTLSTYGLQRFTPDAIRGRVFSFDYGLTTLMIAASVFFAGLAAEYVGPRTVTLLIAASAVAASLVWTLWRRRLLSQPRRRS